MKGRILFIISILLLSIICSAQEKELEVEGGIKIGDVKTIPEPGTIRWTGEDFEGWNGSDWVSLTGGMTSMVMDVEGNEYKTIKIGHQVWMAENLRTKRYRNNTLITLTNSNSTWTSTSSGAYCWYDMLESNDKPFGKLYNWFAVADPRGLCPEGWRVATDNDFIDLLFILSQGNSLSLNAVPRVGGMLKEVAYWNAPNYGATNSTRFSGLGAGIRSVAGAFSQLGLEGAWWSSIEYTVNTSLAWRFKLEYNTDNASLGVVDKNHGFSVRCIKE